MKIILSRTHCGITFCFCVLLCQAALPARLNAALAITAPGSGGLSANTSSGNTYGWSFNVGATNLQVSGLGIWDNGQDGLIASHPVGVWDNSGTLVASTTVEAGTAAPLVGEFRVETLNSPVILSANAIYTIGTLYLGDDSFQNTFATAPTVSSDINSLQPRFANGGTLAEPTASFGSVPYVGPNFQYTAVPEPASSWFFLAGGIVLLGIKFRRARKARTY